jgi:hypothetical protein
MQEPCVIVMLTKDGHLVISVISSFSYCITFRLVSGSGDIKLTKDGNVLLHEMVGMTLIFDFMHFWFLIAV